MKKTLIIILLLSLTGCSNNFGSAVSSEIISIEKESINFIQATELLSVGKYKHVPLYEKDNVKYIVHEYKTPKGEVGYQTIINDGETIKSTCVGVECDGKVYERTIIIKISSTTIKEIK